MQKGSSVLQNMDQIIYPGIVLAVVISVICLVAYRKGVLQVFHRRVIGALVVLYGVYLSTLTGTYTALVLPGIGSVAVGAGAGATIGFATWFALGAVGVATGGTAIAIGAGAMMLIGATVGAAGSAAGGFGIQVITYPLVNPIFWITAIVIGIYIFRGKAITRRKLLPPPESKPDQSRRTET